MYIGRDEKDPNDYILRKQQVEEYGGEWHEPDDGGFDSPQKKLFDYMKHFKTISTTKRIAISSMLDKHPLPQYLR